MTSSPLETLEEPDHHAAQFLMKYQEKNIQLNKNKFTLHSESIMFMGHLTTKDGLQTDREKIRPIANFSQVKTSKNFEGSWEW